MTVAPSPSLFRRQFALGLAGALLTVIGGFGVGDVARNSQSLTNLGLGFATYGHGKTLANTAFWVGVTLLVVAWLWLGRTILGSGQAPTLRQLRIAAIGWAAPFVVSVPLYSRDVYAYLAQGRLYAAGYNPYVDSPILIPGQVLDNTAQVWTTTTSPYSPLFLLMSRGVVTLTGDNAIAGVLLMRLALLPGLAIALWAIPALARLTGEASPTRAVWFVLLNPVMIIHLVGGPHVELLMAAVLAAGVVFAIRGARGPSTRPLLIAIVLIALAGSIKITALVAMPFVLWLWIIHHRRRTTTPASVTDQLRWASVGLAAIIGITAATFGAFTLISGLGFGWLTGLGFAVLIINWLTLPTAAAHLVTVVAAPFTTLHLLPVLTVTRAVGAAVLAAALIWIWWRWRGFTFRHNASGRDTISDVRVVHGIAWAMFAVLVLEPSTLPWYYSWAMVIAAACAIDRRYLAVIAGFTVFLLYVFEPNDEIVMYDTMEVVKALALSVLAGWALWRVGPLLPSRFRKPVPAHAE